MTLVYWTTKPSRHTLSLSIILFALWSECYNGHTMFNTILTSVQINCAFDRICRSIFIIMHNLLLSFSLNILSFVYLQSNLCDIDKLDNSQLNDFNMILKSPIILLDLAIWRSRYVSLMKNFSPLGTSGLTSGSVWCTNYCSFIIVIICICISFI